MSLQITVKNKGQDVVFVGNLNEHSDSELTAAFPEIASQSKFDVSGIEFINSMGVMAWLKFIKALARDHQISFDQCPSEFVEQMNMIPDFHRGTTILSVLRYYNCESCDAEGNMRLINGEHFDTSGMTKDHSKCPTCGALVSFSDSDDDFFAFAKHP